MSVIKFLKTDCQNCYSCIRACSVKAIKVKNSQAEIIEERCIACGKCINVCPKNAKVIASDIEKVESFIKNKEKIAISLAPSFIAAFGASSTKLCAALKSVGFSYVEETSLGAELVNKSYEKYASNLDPKCYITSCCPALNDLIQKYYPDLISNLIPVISPMICHTRLMQKKYGDDTKIVFIGPCIAKKNEAKNEKSIDAIITFEELVNWFKFKGLNLNNFPEIPFDNISSAERSYPIVGGINLNMDKTKLKREIFQIDGIDDCLEILNKIKNGNFKNSFMEMSLCEHGCINGPAMPNNGLTPIEKHQLVRKYATNKENLTNQCAINISIDMIQTFTSKYKQLKVPSETEIKKILERIGKFSPRDELNCGTCGYKTCRDKAIAVYNDMAEPTMCLPYMKQKAENLSNIIFDMTPNIILVINENLEIIDYNSAAENFFNVKRNMAIGLELSMLMDIDIINECIELKKDILHRKVYFVHQDSILLQSVIKIKCSNAYIIILNDLTDILKQQEELQQMKLNAIDMAQNVIDNQMRIAQEIASLLGETTAKTKVSLTKLKKLIEGSEGEPI